MTDFPTAFLLVLALVLAAYAGMVTVASHLTQRYGHEYADQSPVIRFFFDSTRLVAAIGIVSCLTLAVLL